MEYRKEIHIDKETAQMYRKLFMVEPKDESECMGEDETITHTVTFDNGYEMDIKICGVQFREDEPNTPWTEAVLFHDGCEVCCSEPSDDFEGEWELEDDDNVFIVNVIYEGENNG